ncbi:MAG: cache domain-containing protein [Bacteroidota bacterium]
MEANRHRVFVSFLLSHVLILLIPLLAGGLALSEAERVVRAYATETSLSILEQTKDILDARSGELRKMATLLALSPRVRSLAGAKNPISNETYYAIWEMNRDLQPFQLTESFMTTFMLYFRNIGMIVSPYTACPISSLYGYSFQYGGLSEKQWSDKVFSRYYAGEFLPVTPVLYEGNKYSVLPYIQSLPIGQNEQPDAAVIMLIDETQIKKLLARVKVYDHGWVYVADPQGRVITAISGDRAKVGVVDVNPDKPIFQREIARRPMTVIHTKSAYNGWDYVAVLPSAAVMGRVGYIRNLTLGVAMISLLLGLLAAYYLAYRNIKPLKEVVRSLTGLFDGKIDRGGTEYEVLQGTLSAINSVLDDNSSLPARLRGRSRSSRRPSWTACSRAVTVTRPRLKALCRMPAGT